MVFRKFYSTHLFITGILLVLAFNTGCSKSKESNSTKLSALKIISALGVKDNPESPFYIQLNDLPHPSNQKFNNLPIGIFDSGTGGLTILEAMLNIDEFNNDSDVRTITGDGVPDFTDEKFVYFGDMANMPYGNYPSVERADFLAELCLKDALFLLDNQYNLSVNLSDIKKKSSVKTIVIACNTATAYGKKYIEEMIDCLDLEIDVVGVIESGAEGAIENFDKKENGTVGVMATVGTVLSESYPRTLREKIKNNGYTGEIDIEQQGCFGLAGAIDGDVSFIDHNWKNKTLRNEYLGPSLKNKQYKIKKELLPLYNFVKDDYELLIQKNNEELIDIQINSVRNYVRFYVTELVTKITEQKLNPPLRVIILGCTHFPYVENEITEHLEYFSEYQDKNGNRPFHGYLSEKVNLIDPAKLTARKTMTLLINKGILSHIGETKNEFYISCPNKEHTGAESIQNGSFTYDYKYSRKPFYLFSEKNLLPPIYVLRVPMTWQTLNSTAIMQIQERLPSTFEAMIGFNHSSPP